VLDAAISAALGLLPVNAQVKRGSSSVRIGAYTDIVASASIDILASTTVITSVKKQDTLLAIAYGHAESTALVEIAANVVMQAAQVLDILAEANAQNEVTAKNNRFYDEKDPEEDLGGVALALAASYTRLTATATLAAGSSLRAGMTANVRAVGSSDGSTEASAENHNKGKAGIAVALELSKATISTTIDGDITALAGPGTDINPVFDPTAAAGKIGHVDLVRNSILLGPTALRTGDAIVYGNARGDSVGGKIFGLLDGATYYVIRLDEDEVQLAPSLLAAFAGWEIDLGGALVHVPITLAGNLPAGMTGNNDSDPLTEDRYFSVQIATVNVPSSFSPAASAVKKTFDASKIDAAGDRIVFPVKMFTGTGANFSVWGTTLRHGQAVRYDKGAGPAVPGLENGALYFVIAPSTEFDLTGDSRFTTEQVIQLARTYSEALAGQAIDLQAGTGADHTLVALHGFDSGRTDGVGVATSLVASDTASATAGVLDRTGVFTPLIRFSERPTEPVVRPLKQKFVKPLIDGVKKKATDIWHKIKPPKAGAPEAKEEKPKIGIAGAIAVSYADHDVTTLVAGTAVLRSNWDAYATSLIEQRLQVSGQSAVEATRPTPRRSARRSPRTTP
jgi:hypothetical protein